MKAKSSAAGLAEANVLKAKADAAMREAEAVRAKGLAEAESQKAKAEALAAFEGVAQRVEMTRLQLDAQVQIEVARAQALGNALASMNIKLIGDPTAASQLLKMVTMADVLGEVVRNVPQPMLAVGQQILNKVTGTEGDGLLRMAQVPGTEQASGIADLALMVPELIQIAARTLDVNKLKGQSVGDVLNTLLKRASNEDRPKVEKAQQATFTASATDTDRPVQQITFSLAPGAPTNATINPTNGTFEWRPLGSQAEAVAGIGPGGRIGLGGHGSKLGPSSLPE